MEEFCPCCGKRCPKESLSCHRGREYFGGGSERGREGDGDEVVLLLRKCGHTLHHGHGHGPVSIGGLTQEERAQLVDLLKKCLNSLEK